MPADDFRSQMPRHLSTRHHGPSRPSMSLHEKALIAGMLVGFGILHIVAGTILRTAAGNLPFENAMDAHRGD
jgi:hypothetical protein